MFNFRPSIHFLFHRKAIFPVIEFVENLPLTTDRTEIPPASKDASPAIENALNAIGSAIANNAAHM